MTDLLDHLKAAKVGSRELDAKIDEHLGWHLRQYEYDTGWFTPDCKPTSIGPPIWTTSIDDALTLLPKGWEWDRLRSGTINIFKPPKENGEPMWAGVGYGHGATDPLSVCIAIMEARG